MVVVREDVPMEHFDVAVVGLGALGSATAYHLAGRGVRVVGFEQFELGHVRGASHDTSRIVRHSYESEEYVRLAVEAYDEWDMLQTDTDERLITPSGGLVFCAPDTPVPASEYADALAAVDIPFELLSPREVTDRWAPVRLPDGTVTVYTPTSAIAHAARTVATLQLHARVRGAQLRAGTRVVALEPGPDGVVLRTEAGDVRAGRVVLATDAWANDLLAPLGAAIPLEIMQEQVTYFRPDDPAPFEHGRFPNWIWEGPTSFYGFPTYGEPTIKAARDASYNLMTPEERTFVPSEELLAELRAFMAQTFVGSGSPLRTVTCQYAITPGREFILDAVPGHPDIVVGLGAGHAFKFTPVIGRILADLAVSGGTSSDIGRFRMPQLAAR
jgi:sarcosine oxidase